MAVIMSLSKDRIKKNQKTPNRTPLPYESQASSSWDAGSEERTMLYEEHFLFFFEPM
jgi:hypothetical protein